MKLFYGGLPSDDIIRGILAFGEIEKNGISQTATPIIDVILAKPEDLSKKTLGQVGINDIAYVEIGTFWQNKKRLDEKGYWHPLDSRGRKFETFEKDFVFDMRQNADPQFIAFENTGTQPIRERNIFNIALFDDKNNMRSVKDIYPSPFASLVTEQNESVAIPTPLLLVNTLVPRDLDMITPLLRNSLDAFCEEFVVEKICTKNKYTLFTKKAIHHDETAIFLAYLSCNETSRENMGYLFQSLTVDQHDKKHPFLYPYHPGKFKIRAEGIKAAGRYFVQRITRVAPPDEIPVELHYAGITTKDTKKSGDRYPRINTEEIDKECTVTVSEKSASGNKVGIKNVATGLEVDTANVSVDVIIEERTTKRKPVPPEPVPDSGPDVIGSSGETRSTEDARKKAKVIYSRKAQKEGEDNITKMEKILSGLCGNTCRFGYLDANGVKRQEYVDVNEERMSVAIFWVGGYGRTAYFVEILNTYPNDKYRGLFFLKDDASALNVEKFMALLRDKNLRMSKLAPEDMEKYADKYISYTHIGDVGKKVDGLLSEYLGIWRDKRSGSISEAKS